MLTTEQETGRGAPVRRAAPKTGARRYATPHQPKPRPRPDARPEIDGTRPAPDAKRATLDGTRPAPDVKRAAVDGKRSALDAKRPAAARPGTSARAVPRRSAARRQRTPFVLLVVGLMSGGLVSLLLLNTMLARDAITDATLREEIAVARRENEKLDQEYQRKTQPGVIADRAERQGQRRDWNNVNGWSSAGHQAGQVDRER